ncbi:MAG: PD40 domain-containing protein [Desulfobacterales bacterium]|nr:PD40 domain-containing protein [Desulfobacterales bacterium]
MHKINNWDWEIGKKFIADIGELKNIYDYVEEPYISPDGEKIAAVVKKDEAEFTACVNGEIWKNIFERIWNLRFTPDNRLYGFVSDTGEWTLAVDDTLWENRFDFIWDAKVSEDGKNIAAAAKRGMRYCAVVNDSVWETDFYHITNLIISKEGKTAASVQTVPLKEGEITKFQTGCFSAAVDGKVWDKNFINVWKMSFSPDGKNIAAEVRTSLYDYTIAINGIPWSKSFQAKAIWKPVFHPFDGTVTAPAIVNGKWTLVKNGDVLWKNNFVQLWHHCYSRSGKNIAAIVAPKFGEWTVAVNGKTWKQTFDELVASIVFSPDENKVACIAKDSGRWYLSVNGNTWDTSFSMLWEPVFSPDGNRVAVKGEKNGNYGIFLDGKTLREGFSAIGEPVFSPDGKKILIKGVEKGKNKGKYYREIINI